jgi:hypothetical protein
MNGSVNEITTTPNAQTITTQNYSGYGVKNPHRRLNGVRPCLQCFPSLSMIRSSLLAIGRGLPLSSTSLPSPALNPYLEPLLGTSP